MVSLRLGHGAALTVHRTVIHSRAAASLPRRTEKTNEFAGTDVETHY